MATASRELGFPHFIAREETWVSRTDSDSDRELQLGPITGSVWFPIKYLKKQVLWLETKGRFSVSTCAGL